ncbi:MAG: response regulator [Thermodesulfovibrionales bacterium]
MDKKDFKILVADDDEIARDVISSLLSREGYPIVSAQDGIEAIRLLRMEKINLVITDLRMPGADGIEVLKHAVSSSPESAVVILTAYGTLDTTLEAIKQGAYDYLTKPFKIEEIIFLADKAFKSAVLVQENRELTKLLRDTYRNIEITKTVVRSNNPEMISEWMERIERLKTINILSNHEAGLLKERLVKGDDRGDNINSR